MRCFKKRSEIRKQIFKFTYKHPLNYTTCNFDWKSYFIFFVSQFKIGPLSFSRAVDEAVAQNLVSLSKDRLDKEDYVTIVQILNTNLENFNRIYRFSANKRAIKAIDSHISALKEKQNVATAGENKILCGFDELASPDADSSRSVSCDDSHQIKFESSGNFTDSFTSFLSKRQKDSSNLPECQTDLSKSRELETTSTKPPAAESNATTIIMTVQEFNLELEKEKFQWMREKEKREIEQQFELKKMEIEKNERLERAKMEMEKPQTSSSKSPKRQKRSSAENDSKSVIMTVQKLNLEFEKEKFQWMKEKEKRQSEQQFELKKLEIEKSELLAKMQMEKSERLEKYELELKYKIHAHKKCT